MTLFVALILGIVQGLTEFLPVSSSGHLTLLNKIFGIQGDFLLVTVLLHLATLFAVFYVFRKEIWELIKHPFSKDAVNLYIATIPTVIIVLLTKGLLEDAFASAKLLPYCFLITAILLFFTYLLSKKKKDQIQYRQLKKSSAFIMGVAQGLAVMPGISRSGSTICAGLLAGEECEKTTQFSFLMSIPIILASMAYEFITADLAAVSTSNMIIPLIFAFLSAFIVGIFSIKFMLKIVKNAKYYWFSIYLVALSIVAFFVV